MESFVRDLRVAARGLAKRPGFTAAAVLCLALGIGANSAVFSVVNAVLLRDLPYDEPERVVLIFGRFLSGELTKIRASGHEFVDYKNEIKSLENLSAVIPLPVNLTGRDEPERLLAARASASLFPMLGVEAALGRTFTADEDRFGNQWAAILTDGLWRRRFNADPDVVGQQISLNDRLYTVVGVLPPEFSFAFGASSYDLFVPVAINYEQLPPRGARGLNIVGRLKDGVSLQEGQAEVDVLARRFLAAYPELYERGGGWDLDLVPVQEELIGGVRSALYLLLAAVALVLLIACTNVASLLLARATARSKEVAVRSALGAGRWRLIRQFLTESSMLALAGGALGLLLAYWGVKTLVAVDPSYIPRLKEVGIDARVLGFTLLVSLLTGVLFGLVPALQASKSSLHENLKEGGRSAASGRTGHLLRAGLVVFEVAVAAVVLVGAGLTLRSFLNLMQVDPGFATEGRLSAQIFLSPIRYSNPDAVAGFARDLLGRLEAQPGADAVALTSNLPVSGIPVSVARTTVLASGFSPEDSELPTTTWQVTPSYFDAMGIPLLRGRAFTVDDAASGADVVIVDSTLAQRFWPNESALGKQLQLATVTGPTPPLTIIGVVGHVKDTNLESAAKEQTYQPFFRSPPTTIMVAVRTRGNPRALVQPLRQAVAAIDSDQPMTNLATMEERVQRSASGRRAYAFLLGAFAAVALALVALGVYGVMSYSVAQRSQEFGIRMAMGARRLDLLRLVVARGMTLAGIGLAVGVVAALGSGRMVGGLLFGVTATDPATFGTVIAVLLGLALLATYIPAYRATRVDPVTALHYE